ncbi:MAG: hydrogenase nickel incorporation protein HypB, partial [Caballeronia sp.]|nr:hydrogenase nickel incorporation protein HypB [Caballeronia sp.]
MCTTCGCSKGAGSVITDPLTGERIESQVEEESGAVRTPGSWRQLAGGATGGSVAAHLHARAHRHGHAAHIHQHGTHQQVHEHEHDGHVHSHEHDHVQTPAALDHGDHPGAEHSSVSPSEVAIAAATHGTTIALEQDVLAKNQLLAEHNRGWLASRHITALNLVSSPGAGKTTL